MSLHADNNWCAFSTKQTSSSWLVPIILNHLGVIATLSWLLLSPTIGNNVRFLTCPEVDKLSNASPKSVIVCCPYFNPSRKNDNFPLFISNNTPTVSPVWKWSPYTLNLSPVYCVADLNDALWFVNPLPTHLPNLLVWADPRTPGFSATPRNIDPTSACSILNSQ